MKIKLLAWFVFLGFLMLSHSVSACPDKTNGTYIFNYNDRLSVVVLKGETTERRVGVGYAEANMVVKQDKKSKQLTVSLNFLSDYSWYGENLVGVVDNPCSTGPYVIRWEGSQDYEKQGQKEAVVHFLEAITQYQRQL